MRDQGNDENDGDVGTSLYFGLVNNRSKYEGGEE